MAATQKVMEQLLDGNGEALRLSGELVLAKNKGETFAQHAADTTRHLTTAQVDTAIETALAPVQEELNQIANGGTNGGDSLKVGDILLTTNPTRDVSSFLPADGSRIRAEPYPDLGQVLGTELVSELLTKFDLTSRFKETGPVGACYYNVARSSNMIIASVAFNATSTSSFVNKCWKSVDGIKWEEKVAPSFYFNICHLNDQWICSTRSYTWVSKDFENWKQKSVPGGSSSSAIPYNMGYGDGVYFCAPGQISSRVYVSTDDMNSWNNEYINTDKNTPLISAYKDGFHILFEARDNANGKMHYSTDKGKTWTTTELPAKLSEQMQPVERNGKLFLLTTGTVLISTELPTWEVYPVEVTTGSSSTFYTGSVFYAEGIFFAAANSESIYGTPYAVSMDGIKWTLANVPLVPNVMSALGTGDGTLIFSIRNGRYAELHSGKQTFSVSESWLTLPNVTCPGAKAYVKAL